MADAQNIHKADWNDTTCPDGVKSDDCYGENHLTPTGSQG